MSKKIRVGVLFGGRSGEHEVSLRSAASVIAALDRSKYDVLPMAITKDGQWLPPAQSARLLPDPRPAIAASRTRALTIQPVPHSADSLDVVFPVLHGTFGEDGTVQGLLELAGLPYVGSGVLGSAASMDKDVMKRLFRERGLPTPRHAAFLRGQASPAKILRQFELPVFVKPANLGSSVGITKAHDRRELVQALDLAARYDRKILVEEFIDGREIECSVLGNSHPDASVPGEIIPCHEFYDYEAKYLDDRSELIIPARLTHAQTRRVQQLAVAAFLACECAGLARVDFFLERPTGRILVNEVNTMPGFTSISMYPKLWEASGLPYPVLLDRLIEFAFERHAEKTGTQFSR